MNKRIFAILSFMMLVSTARADVVVYLHPNGSDSASGFQESEPVATLSAAIRRVISAGFQPGEHLKIVVGGGIYLAQKAVIKGLPEDNPLSISSKEGRKAVFDGDGKVRTRLVLDNGDGKQSKLTVSGLEIRNYANAISLNGDRASSDKWNGGNVIKNNIFRNIGQIAIPSGLPSTAAIRLVNSNNNMIVNNTFINVRNISGCGALHAIYMAHYSSSNLIEGNVFQNGCGATIKVRDASNANAIRKNRFVSQDDQLFLDSYCNQDIRGDCTKAFNECPSWGNEIVNNSSESLGRRARESPISILGSDKASGCPLEDQSRPRYISHGNSF